MESKYGDRPTSSSSASSSSSSASSSSSTFGFAPPPPRRPCTVCLEPSTGWTARQLSLHTIAVCTFCAKCSRKRAIKIEDHALGNILLSKHGVASRRPFADADVADAPLWRPVVRRRRGTDDGEGSSRHSSRPSTASTVSRYDDGGKGSDDEDEAAKAPACNAGLTHVFALEEWHRTESSQL